MRLVLLGAIWLSLVLFVLGEAGKRELVARGAAPQWMRHAWTVGALACLAHILIVFGVVHRWSHDAAVVDTARQTLAVFGIAWSGSIYVNYVFLGLWFGEAIAWHVQPRSYARQLARLQWPLRAFYFVVIFNAAIVFARPAARWLGVAVVAALLWTWFGASNRTSPTRPIPHLE
jgi:hypothetical protein